MGCYAGVAWTATAIRNHRGEGRTGASQEGVRGDCDRWGGKRVLAWDGYNPAPPVGNRGGGEGGHVSMATSGEGAKGQSQWGGGCKGWVGPFGEMGEGKAHWNAIQKSRLKEISVGGGGGG